MHKHITTLLLLGTFFTVQAQTSDSVSTGASNAKDVYYSFSNGIIKSQPNNDWDLAFEISGFAASILANHVKGMLVWQSPYSYSQWTNFDTTNHKSWKKMYNSPKRWDLGAFNLHNNNNNDPYDLGWGTYEPSSHIVSGDSVFLLKLPNGSFKKLTILTLSSGIYTIKYANIDGTTEKIKSIDKLNFKGKNFGYFSFDTENTLDREPLTAEWDIVFTKYTEFIPTPYNVGGVWANKGIKCAEARDVPVTTNDYSGFTFTDNNSEIGYDWKSYNQALNKYVITDRLVYFVTTPSTTWKIVFTGYKGGGNGTYYFNKQTVTASTKFPKISSGTIFPNPANGILNIKLTPENSLISYTISTISGQEVLTGSENKIEISALAPGIYFINLQTQFGFQVLKFSKI